jgi:hypothetical protein
VGAKWTRSGTGTVEALYGGWTKGESSSGMVMGREACEMDKRRQTY